MDVLEFLQQNNITFTLHYFGKSDFGTGWDIKAIVDNFEEFKQFVKQNKLKEISSINEFLYFLFLNKIQNMKELIPLICADENKDKINEISILAEKSNCINEGDVIGQCVALFNNHLADLFNEKYRKLFIEDDIINILAKCICGIKACSIKNLALSLPYVIINNFDVFKKKICEDLEIFKYCFPKDYVFLCSLRLERTLSIFSDILNSKSKKYKIVQGYIEDLISFIYNNLCEEASKNNEDLCLLLDSKLKALYKFFVQREDTRANAINKKIRINDILLKRQLEKNGKCESWIIDVEKNTKLFKELGYADAKLLSLTHCNAGNSKIASQLDFDFSKEKHFVDMCSTTFPTNLYYTASCQHGLMFVSAEFSSNILYLLNHDNSCSEYCACLEAVVDKLDSYWEISHISTRNLLSSFIKQWAMYRACKQSIDDANHLLYGCAMTLCCMIENMLKAFIIEQSFDKEIIRLKFLTLGGMLNNNDTNENKKYIKKAFGKFQILNLKYFLLSNENEIGKNYRNRLAHFSEIEIDEINEQLVGCLSWLATDVANSLYLFYKK